MEVCAHPPSCGETKGGKWMTALIDGPVGRSLLRFVLPILAGNILQQLYNSIDAMIIGRFVGENALGAIGVSQPIISVVLALVIGVWCALGFGVSRLDITFFHTPLWAITGCLGTWIFSILAVWWLIKRVFRDFDLDEEEE